MTKTNGSLIPAALVPFASYVFLVSAIFFSPFYFFPSGYPQPAHVTLFLSAFVILFSGWRGVRDFLFSNKNFLRFLFLVFLINFGYCIYYNDFSFVVSSVYWIYGVVLLGAVFIIATDGRYSKFIRYLIAFKLAVVVVVYLSGFGNYMFWPRYDYFFNGPNQLAYFSICMLLVFVAVNRSRVDWLFFVVYSCSIFIIISTGGRSAYFAIFPLVLLLMYISRGHWFKVIGILAIPFVVNVLFSSICLPFYTPVDFNRPDELCVSKTTVDRIATLNASGDEKDVSSVKLQFSARGYMRLVKYPEYMVFGAGQGRDERFGEVGGYVYEMHSSLGAILFYYGVLGLLLFCKSIYDVFLCKFNILFMVPIFAYGLFTYGLRSPYFWISLGFLALMPSIEKLKNYQESSLAT